MYQSLKKLYFLLNRKDKIKIIFLFLIMIIGSFLEILGISAIPAFIAILTNPEKVMELPRVGSFLQTYGPDKQTDILYWGATALLIVFISKNLFISWLHHFKSSLAYKISIRISKRIFRAYLAAPYEFHMKKKYAKLVSNVNDLPRIAVTEVLLPIMTLVMNTLLGLFIFTLLILVEPIVTLIAFIVLGASGLFFLRLVKNKTRKFGLEQQQLRAKNLETISQSLSGLKEIRILNRNQYFLEKFSKGVTRSAIAGKHHRLTTALPKPIIETIAVTGMLLVVITMVLRSNELENIVPMLALFGLATIRLMPTINLSVTNFTTIRFQSYTLDPLYDDFMLLKKLKKENVAVKYNAVVPYNFSQSINIKNISYSYPGAEERAVKNLSLQIPKGSAVAFVGESGAGKTTLVDLLLGLLEPQEGQICVDEQSIYNDINRWRTLVGYIPQEIYLMDETVKKNIAIGIPENEIEEAKMDKAIKAAQLNELIANLPNGLDTYIGERGVRLSGGQRQRIGIARALYHNPQILVMDEATSALDNVTEKYVIEAIEKLKGDRTIIMIAHRLTTVKNCDTLYFMNKGNIEAFGSYNELIKTSENFKVMAL